MDLALLDFEVESIERADPAETLVQINGLDDGVHIRKVLSFSVL
jgi:hypothetical protein